jgi:hypothetical protein
VDALDSDATQLPLAASGRYHAASVDHTFDTSIGTSSRCDDGTTQQAKRQWELDHLHSTQKSSHSQPGPLPGPISSQRAHAQKASNKKRSGSSAPTAQLQGLNMQHVSKAMTALVRIVMCAPPHAEVRPSRGAACCPLAPVLPTLTFCLLNGDKTDVQRSIDAKRTHDASQQVCRRSSDAMLRNQLEELVGTSVCDAEFLNVGDRHEFHCLLGQQLAENLEEVARGVAAAKSVVKGGTKKKRKQGQALASQECGSQVHESQVLMSQSQGAYSQSQLHSQYVIPMEGPLFGCDQNLGTTKGQGMQHHGIH